MFLELNKRSYYLKIREKRDIFAFERIVNKSGNSSACPVGDRSIFKITRVIFYVSCMGVFEVGFLEAENLGLNIIYNTVNVN